MALTSCLKPLVGGCGVFQTVSWLSSAPAVLEQCARYPIQPQLLKTMLQHEKCLGHLDSAGEYCKKFMIS